MIFYSFFTKRNSYIYLLLIKLVPRLNNLNTKKKNITISTLANYIRKICYLKKSSIYRIYITCFKSKADAGPWRYNLQVSFKKKIKILCIRYKTSQHIRDLDIEKILIFFYQYYFSKSEIFCVLKNRSSKKKTQRCQ